MHRTMDRANNALYAEEYGTLRRAPWELKYGANRPTHPYPEFHEAWPALKECEQIPLNQIACDFYVLEFLIASGYEPAETVQTKLITKLDYVFQQYTWCVIGGELRHHGAVLDLVLPNDRFEAYRAWSMLCNKVGPPILLDAAFLMRDFLEGIINPEDVVYGGEAWAAICELLHDRLLLRLGRDVKSNRKVFVDRVFNLHHNTGALLNKLNWASDPTGLAPSALLWLLDAHGSEKPVLSRLLTIASPETNKMFDAYAEQDGAEHPFSHTESICDVCWGGSWLGHFDHCAGPVEGTKKVLVYRDEYLHSQQSLLSDGRAYTFSPDGKIYIDQHAPYTLDIWTSEGGTHIGATPGYLISGLAIKYKDVNYFTLTNLTNGIALDLFPMKVINGKRMKCLAELTRDDFIAWH